MSLANDFAVHRSAQRGVHQWSTEKVKLHCSVTLTLPHDNMLRQVALITDLKASTILVWMQHKCHADVSHHSYTPASLI